MTPSWLTKVLTRYEALDLTKPEGREVLAVAILAAMPKDVMVEAIKESAFSVLKCRGIADGDRALSREIANNATQSLLIQIEVDR